jgi:hypothetical protein
VTFAPQMAAKRRNHKSDGRPRLPLIYWRRDAELIPSFRAADEMVSPEPSRRFPRSELIARSSQMRGVREEEEVTTGRLAEDGIGVRGRSRKRALPSASGRGVTSGEGESPSSSQ